MTIVRPPISAAAGSRPALDVAKLRAEFPALRLKVRGRPLVYLDNAATSQKPRAVLDALTRYYEEGNANVHRGVHYLSEHATAAYDGAREKARRFLGDKEAREVLFVRGTAEGVNLVVLSFGHAHLKSGEEVVVCDMEYSSNVVP